MKLPIRLITISAVALGAVAYFVLGLLTNYASETIPNYIAANPLVLWFLIAGTLTIIVGLTLYNSHAARVETARTHSTSEKTQGNSKAMEYKYDVFISYSHEDRDWVYRKLVPYLQEHNFSVFTDRDFETGALSVNEMQRGVECSRRVVAVLSTAYEKSKWSTLENAMAQTLDPDASFRKLIPILFEPCKIPLRLRVLHYRDLTSDSTEQWNRLVEDLV
jgi:hypothetical protein